ncbi:TIR domain-containing protein [Shimia sp. R9_3]|uniref:TIR domain-containing protein n=1 Tax=Shimia sp. R9_3 TaxID=2821113 RepID=UPI001AD965B2|nr:TIR domain-containing protein [Shimia sp. R9_3]
MFSDKGCTLSDDYREVATVAFQGGGTGYLSGSTDTGVPIREFFAVPDTSVTDLLKGAQKSLILIFLSKTLLQNKEMVANLNKLLSRRTRPNFQILIFDLEQQKNALLKRAPAFDPNDIIDVLGLGEYALRRTAVGLIALHIGVGILSKGSKRITKKPKFFVSHAKIDGQSLATVLRTQIKDLPGFQTFYDDDDISEGDDLKQVLSNGVENSVLIVLRSEVFEDRPWCLQEMHWAEEYASPYVVVDLRQKAITPPSAVSFERAPTVKVADGNLYRIVFIALREALRSRIHIRIVEDLAARGITKTKGLHILVRQPTMRCLHKICSDLKPGEETTIVYPDPSMTEGDRAAAEALVRSMSAKSLITTPQTLVLDCATRRAS